MKNILIVGKNSYLGKVFMKRYEYDFSYKCISVRDSEWENIDYLKFDCIIYFAAIVHQPNINDKSLYYSINAYTPYQMAMKAQSHGVRQFIYISSVAVWGIAPLFGKENSITTTTPLFSNTLYGKSKIQGEILLTNPKLFKDIVITIIRLPNVYGPNCPGNIYKKIKSLAKVPILPIYHKQYLYSMISVYNVAVALHRLISENREGIFCPQDPQILSITQRIAQIAKEEKCKQFQIRVFSPLIWLLSKICPNKYLNNLYGGYYIDPTSYPIIVE